MTYRYAFTLAPELPISWRFRSLDQEHVDLAVPIKPKPLINLPDILLIVAGILGTVAFASAALAQLS